jgi:hypothetical protein
MVGIFMVISWCRQLMWAVNAFLHRLVYPTSAGRALVKNGQCMHWICSLRQIHGGGTEITEEVLANRLDGCSEME